jgi:hypothetical protein
MLTMDELLDALDESRERLLVAIEPLPDEALLQKGAVEGWSITDILINLTAWEAELVTGLMRLDQKKKPGRLLEALADSEAYDRLRYDENQDRDLDQIFDDWQLVRVQTEDWLAGISDKALGQNREFLDGRSLAAIVAATTYERELRVLPQIEAFAQQWLDAQEALPEDIIPLTTIDMIPSEEDDEDPD